MRWTSCNSFDFVRARFGQQLHAGWFYSLIAGLAWWFWLSTWIRQEDESILYIHVAGEISR